MMFNVDQSTLFFALGHVCVIIIVIIVIIIIIII